MLNEEDSTNEEELGGELPDPKNEMDDEDTIATKDFNTSTVHLNLKIIRLEYNLRKARMRMMEKKKNMKRWK